MNKNEIFSEQPSEEILPKGHSRRSFLGLAGGLLAVGSLFNASCDNKDNNPNPEGVLLTQDDIGILNYAYALKQLEAAFYQKIFDTGVYNTATSEEIALLTDIRDHEVAHRELLKAILGSKAIDALSFNFAGINFKDKKAVLDTAKLLEDIGVSGINGVAVHVVNTDYLKLLGKIASVEARHAAYIRDLLIDGTFASGDAQVGMNGLEMSKNPSVVLAAASTFITTQIINRLP